jgi:hypothetical protein
MPDREGINPEILAIAKEISLIIKQRLPEGMGFSVMLFDSEDDGFYWVSNGNKQDIINALRVIIRENDVH